MPGTGIHDTAAATIAAIRQAWLDNIVLVFRDQNLTQDDLLRVTAWFGELGAIARPKELRPAGYQRLLDNIMLISNIRENGEPIGALPDGEMMFHHAMMHAEGAIRKVFVTVNSGEGGRNG